MDNVFAFNTGNHKMLLSISDPIWKRRILYMRRQYQDVKITSKKGDAILTAEMPVSYLHIIKSLSAKERKRCGKYDCGFSKDKGKYQ